MEVPCDRPKGKQVLLVEDDQRLRQLLARYLHALGHDVIEVSGAEEAMDQLASLPVEVLLLDVNLADGTGWSVMRWLAEHRSEESERSRPTVVILSAVPPSPKRIEQFRPDAVLNKPFPIDALGRLVESSFRSRAGC